MKKGEILIYGQIGEDWWTGEGWTAKKFSKELARAAKELEDSDDPITVRVNSPGGSVIEGVAIYNQIAGSDKEVHCYVDGVAYSMGAIIALAGKKSYMAKNATMLLHNVSGYAYGNARDIEGSLEMMKKLDDSLCISIGDKTGLSVDEVKAKWMDYRDHTLSAEEAKEAKLVDGVLDVNGQVPDDLKNMTPAQINAWINEHCQEGKGQASWTERIANSVVATLRPLFNNKGQQEPPNNQPLNITNQNQKNMKFVAATYVLLAAVFGLQADAGEVTVEPTADQLAQLNNTLKEHADLKAANATLEQSQKDLQAKLNGVMTNAGVKSTGDLAKDLEALEASAKEWGENSDGGSKPRGAAGDPPPGGGENEFRCEVDEELEGMLNLTKK